MARNEADHVDLFADAVALVRRLEGRDPEAEAVVVAGFKSNGHVSIYLGPDLDYQCDADGRLRRAYDQGGLYRTQGITLALLRRHRTESETTLIRTDLTECELQTFRHVMKERLRRWLNSIRTHKFNVLRRFPEADFRVEFDLAAAVDGILAAEPWLAPALAGK